MAGRCIVIITNTAYIQHYSSVIIARVWGFRGLKEGETEIQYRTDLADFVQDKDMIESMEIRTGKGWDKFTTGDEASTLARVFDAKWK